MIELHNNYTIGDCIYTDIEHQCISDLVADHPGISYEVEDTDAHIKGLTLCEVEEGVKVVWYNRVIGIIEDDDESIKLTGLAVDTVKIFERFISMR